MKSTEKNGSTAVLKHGERVQVLEVRRRYVRVRTEHGAEGWIDSTQLLTADQMKQIRQEAAHSLTLPSEGSATVFEALNIHLDPSRQSPAFARISETDSVQVLGHSLTPKITGPAKPPVFAFQSPQQAATRKARKGKKAKEVFRLPPPPAPPKAPENWLDLSGSRGHGTGGVKAAAPSTRKQVEPPRQPVVMEDWSLVRTKDKQCGWVLSRNLIMSIPDEVAQYAEGKRITSYFELGSVEDEVKGKKHDWLWTTASESESYDFDAWRVFIWSRHRHRYETSYRERDLEGYFPVQVEAAEANSAERIFRIITKDDDGKLWCRTYHFDGTLVRLAGKDPYAPSAAAPSAPLVQMDGGTQHGRIRNGWNRLKQSFSIAR